MTTGRARVIQVPGQPIRGIFKPDEDKKGGKGGDKGDKTSTSGDKAAAAPPGTRAGRGQDAAHQLRLDSVRAGAYLRWSGNGSFLA